MNGLKDLVLYLIYQTVTFLNTLTVDAHFFCFRAHNQGAIEFQMVSFDNKHWNDVLTLTLM